MSLLSARGTICKVIGHTWDWTDDVLSAAAAVAALDTCPDCEFDVDENDTRPTSVDTAAKRDAAYRKLPLACDCSNVVKVTRDLGIERFPRYVTDGHCGGSQQCLRCKLPYHCQPLKCTVNVLTKRRSGDIICEPKIAVPQELSSVWRFEGVLVTVGCKCAMPAAAIETSKTTIPCLVYDKRVQ